MATDLDLVQTLKILPEIEYRYFVMFMILTGRRGKDIEELTWEGIKVRKGDWMCILPRDKCNRNNLVSFVINFQADWDLEYPLDDFKIWVETGMKEKRGNLFRFIERTGQPFSRQIISINCKTFKPHSIRNRKALVMLIKGHTEATIMSKIGWADMQSVLRYAKISTDSIQF